MKKTAILFSLLLAVTAWSCKKDSSTSPSGSSSTSTTTTTATINSSPRITGKIDGVAYSKISDGTTIQDGTGSSLSLTTLPDSSTGKYSCYFTDVSGSTSYFDVSKGTLTFAGFPPTNAAFKAFFNPGTYYYSPGAYSGIVVTYYDSAGQSWSTSNGGQTGTFVISEIKEVTLGGYYYIKVKANFTCTLYDGLGHSKAFTDGVLIGSFCNQ